MLFAAILLTLVILGIFLKEVRFMVTTRIHAPVADSWTTFMDIDRRELWQTNLTRIETVHGLPFALDSVFRAEFADGSSQSETVTSIIAMKEYNAEIKTVRYSGFRSVTFQTLEEGSRIQQTITLRGSSFLSRALLPVLRPWMQRDERNSLKNLAGLIEASPSIHPPSHED